MVKNKYLKILAIETSCDETAAAVISGCRKGHPKILSNVVASQIKIHRITNGVIPEIASRAHIEKIIPVIQKALKKAKTKIKEVDFLAVTVGPGLIGSLLIGIDTAKTLSYALNKPIIPINHIEAHIYANFVHKISKLPITNYQLPKFPAIVLVVSGGHTQLILMRGHGDYKIIGSTIDDAAGEAFDKVARILNLSYPGGPAISAAASKSYKLKVNDLNFPRPMIDSNDFNFSFSGLKTAVLYKVKELTNNHNKSLNHSQITAVAAEFQKAVVDVLVAKTIRAARIYKARCIMLGGGVAANSVLKKEMDKAAQKIVPNSYLLIPDSSLCTDNAAVIGLNAFFRYAANKNIAQQLNKIKVNLNPKL